MEDITILFAVLTAVLLSLTLVFKVINDKMLREMEEAYNHSQQEYLRIQDAIADYIEQVDVFIDDSEIPEKRKHYYDIGDDGELVEVE